MNRITGVVYPLRVGCVVVLVGLRADRHRRERPTVHDCNGHRIEQILTRCCSGTETSFIVRGGIPGEWDPHDTKAGQIFWIETERARRNRCEGCRLGDLSETEKPFVWWRLRTAGRATVRSRMSWSFGSPIQDESDGIVESRFSELIDEKPTIA